MTGATVIGHTHTHTVTDGMAIGDIEAEGLSEDDRHRLNVLIVLADSLTKAISLVAVVDDINALTAFKKELNQRKKRNDIGKRS